MATLTIDGVGTELERKLSALAAEHGSTVPQEVVRIVEDALSTPPTNSVEETSHARPSPTEMQTGAHFYARVRALVEQYGSFDLEIPPRGPSHRTIPDFSEWPD